MEPRPPEVSQRRGESNLMNCAAHIWCWPTSVVTMASPPEMRFDFGHDVLRLDLVRGHEGR